MYDHLKAFAAGVLVAILVTICLSFNDTEYTVLVTEKARIPASFSNSSYYLIYCQLSNGEIRVFKNSDNWIRGKTASSDMYALLEPGKYYRFTVIGKRVPLLDMYENILTAEEAPITDDQLPNP